MEGKVYYFDIDGTITNETEGWDYENRTPRLDVIDKMNDLFLRYVIVLWTARYEIDRTITEEWLLKHTVPYDRLVMGKPKWDLYVCDKSVNINEWMKE